MKNWSKVLKIMQHASGRIGGITPKTRHDFVKAKREPYAMMVGPIRPGQSQSLNLRPGFAVMP